MYVFMWYREIDVTDFTRRTTEEEVSYKFLTVAVTRCRRLGPFV